MKPTDTGYDAVAEFDHIPNPPNERALNDAKKRLAQVERAYNFYQKYVKDPAEYKKEVAFSGKASLDMWIWRTKKEYEEELTRIAQAQATYDQQKKVFGDFEKEIKRVDSLRDQVKTDEVIEQADKSTLAGDLLSETTEIPPDTSDSESFEQSHIPETLAMSPEEYVNKNFAAILDITSKIEKDIQEHLKDQYGGMSRYSIPQKMIIPALGQFCQKYLRDCGIDLTRRNESIASEAVERAIGKQKWELIQAEKEDRQEDKGYINRTGIVTLDDQPILDYTSYIGVWDEGNDPGRGDHFFVEDDGREDISVNFKTDYLKQVLTSAIEYTKKIAEDEQS